MRYIALSSLEAAKVVAVGYDMTAALAYGAAAGVPAPALAEFLPIIERAAVAAFNEASND